MFKEIGVPDAVVTSIAGLLLVLGLSPWLDLSWTGVELRSAVPWYVSPFFALLFVLLFIPWIPSSPSLAEKELVHRFYWLREHLLVENLTVDSAQEACNALDGAGGKFRSTEKRFIDKHIEPLFDDVEKFKPWLDHAIQLRRLCGRLPTTIHPGDMVDTDVASQLRDMASKLPTGIAQQGAPADAAPRHD